MVTLTEKNKEWLKSIGAAFVIAVSAVWFLTHEMHAMSLSINKEMHAMELRLNEKIAGIDKRVIVMETVLMMQRYHDKSIAVHQEK
jgi:hypothetical protein